MRSVRSVGSSHSPNRNRKDIRASKNGDALRFSVAFNATGSPMVNQPTIAKYLALFQELYPTRDVTDLTVEAWAMALDDLNDVGFQWACEKVLKESGRQFFPTPNEIRGYLHNPDRTTATMLPSNSPVTKAIDAHYAAEAKTSKRLTSADASD